MHWKRQLERASSNLELAGRLCRDGSDLSDRHAAFSGVRYFVAATAVARDTPESVDTDTIAKSWSFTPEKN